MPTIDGKVRVLFVCMGNICRSPAGEGLFIAHVAAAGQTEKFEIDSAGTGGWHAGDLADPRMRQAAARRGVKFESRARQVKVKDFEAFDLIVAMDRQNLAHLQAMGRARPGQLFLLSELLGPEWPRDVPDPYYGGPEGFEKVLDMLDAAMPALLERALAAGAAAGGNQADE
jgi:protein-tyrosine phosphatase